MWGSGEILGMMKNLKLLYDGHCFPAVISCAVRWYFRFQFGLRDIAALPLERGVIVSYETVRVGAISSVPASHTV